MSRPGETVLTVHVPGRPVQQGSQKWMPNRRLKYTNRDALLPWRDHVAARLYGAALTAGIETPFRGPVGVGADFFFARSQSHFGTGRNAGVLKASAPLSMVKTPDLDKLHRALMDAVTQSGLWKDDKQYCRTDPGGKFYADAFGMTARISMIHEEEFVAKKQLIAMQAHCLHPNCGWSSGKGTAAEVKKWVGEHLDDSLHRDFVDIPLWGE